MNETPDSTSSVEHEQTELARCPFCGSNVMRLQDWSYDDPWFAVQCIGSGCGCSVGSSNGYDEAVERWNKRPSPWIKTSERRPTRADGDKFGDVLWRWEDESVECHLWNDGQHSKGAFYWMPIPELPVPEA